MTYSLKVDNSFKVDNHFHFGYKVYNPVEVDNPFNKHIWFKFPLNSTIPLKSTNPKKSTISLKLTIMYGAFMVGNSCKVYLYSMPVCKVDRQSNIFSCSKYLRTINVIRKIFKITNKVYNCFWSIFAKWLDFAKNILIYAKEFSLTHKFKFSNSYILAI